MTTGFRPRRRRVAADRPRLGVSGFNGVIGVDPAARTADVQAMCTYEALVDATPPYGLMPLVVPQVGWLCRQPKVVVVGRATLSVVPEGSYHEVGAV
jgi:FAD/FMN-containing dehydrogenase